jgi:hypothetical protein
MCIYHSLYTKLLEGPWATKEKAEQIMRQRMKNTVKENTCTYKSIRHKKIAKE